VTALHDVHAESIAAAAAAPGVAYHKRLARGLVVAVKLLDDGIYALAIYRPGGGSPSMVECAAVAAALGEIEVIDKGEWKRTQKGEFWVMCFAPKSE